jgi:carboxypeptidase C (cathepsin A)
LSWKGRESFVAEEFLEWSVNPDANATGEFKTSGSLTFFRVYDAGKMVPKD